MKIVDNGRMKILYPTSEHFKLIKVGDESGALFDVVYLSKHAKVEDYTEILIEEAEGFGKELRSLQSDVRSVEDKVSEVAIVNDEQDSIIIDLFIELSILQLTGGDF